MNLEKVVFGFFVLLAATLNFGFFIGDIGDPELHNVYELFAAVVVNLIATVLKFGDRTQIGAVHLATSLVADLQLISRGAGRGATRATCPATGSPREATASVVSLSGGALLANIVSVVLLVVETVSFHRARRSAAPAWATRCSSSGRGCSPATSERPSAGRAAGGCRPRRPRRPRRRSSWSCAGCGRR